MPIELFFFSLCGAVGSPFADFGEGKILPIPLLAISEVLSIDTEVLCMCGEVS